MAGGAWPGGRACWGVCECLGGMHGWGACMPGGGGVHGREACMAGGMHATCLGGMCGKGACMPRSAPLRPDTTRYGRSMSGRYASYWNAFLFDIISAKNCTKMKINHRSTTGVDKAKMTLMPFSTFILECVKRQ